MINPNFVGFAELEYVLSKEEYWEIENYYESLALENWNFNELFSLKFLLKYPISILIKFNGFLKNYFSRRLMFANRLLYVKCKHNR